MPSQGYVTANYAPRTTGACPGPDRSAPSAPAPSSAPSSAAWSGISSATPPVAVIAAPLPAPSWAVWSATRSKTARPPLRQPRSPAARHALTMYRRRTVQRCRTVYDGRDEIVGYNVVYRYQGRDYTTRMAYDPVPR